MFYERSIFLNKVCSPSFRSLLLVSLIISSNLFIGKTNADKISMITNDDGLLAKPSKLASQNCVCGCKCVPPFTVPTTCNTTLPEISDGVSTITNETYCTCSCECDSSCSTPSSTTIEPKSTTIETTTAQASTTTQVTPSVETTIIGDSTTTPSDTTTHVPLPTSTTESTTEITTTNLITNTLEPKVVNTTTGTPLTSNSVAFWKF